MRPAISKLRLYKWYWMFGSNEPPLGLLYLASYLDAHGIEVLILDGERMGRRTLLQRLGEFAPDVVGVTSTTFSFFEAADLLKAIRVALPCVRTVMGGPHVTPLAEDSLARVPELDACVIGEGEHALCELAMGSPLASIAGIVWRDPDGVVRRNATRKVPDNLDEYPLRWELLEGFPHSYGPAYQSARGRSPVSLMASRGCPFPCTFCAGPVALGKRRRAHSPARVVEMMSECNSRFGTSHFYFHDDHFTLDRPWLAEFCEEALRAPAQLRWSCASRLEPLDTAMLARMAAAGCYQIGLGGESGSTEVLRRLDKRLTTTRLEAGVRRIQEAGIEVKLYLIIGTPGETDADRRRTLAFTSLLGVNHVQVLYFTPLPGSPSWRQHAVDSKLWRQMNLLNPMPCCETSMWKLRAVELRLYAQVYLFQRLQRTRRRRSVLPLTRT
jgi:radical SAM superfamily enzyme YgiQ (UPF0313 family)